MSEDDKDERIAKVLHLQADELKDVPPDKLKEKILEALEEAGILGAEAVPLDWSAVMAIFLMEGVRRSKDADTPHTMPTGELYMVHLLFTAGLLAAVDQLSGSAVSAALQAGYDAGKAQKEKLLEARKQAHDDLPEMYPAIVAQKTKH